MTDLPDDLQQSLTSFDKTLADIEAALAPFLNDAELTNHISPFENAKLNLVVGYAINTLFFSTEETQALEYVYLKTQGVNATDHPVKAELDTIKNYIQRLKNLTDEEKTRGNTTKRSLVPDVEAVSRFIARSTAPSASNREAVEDAMDEDPPAPRPAAAKQSKPASPPKKEGTSKQHIQPGNKKQSGGKKK